MSAATRAVRTSVARAGRRAALAALLLCGACGVPRAAPSPRTAPDELPRLRRASQALRERIATEKQHVEAFNRELEQLRAREGALYGLVLDAEEAYQRLQADVDALHADLAVAEGELEASRARLGDTRAALAAAQAELAGAERDLERVRTSAEAARGETRFWMDEEELARATLAGVRATLERFRVRWRVPRDAWAALFAELGARHLVDATLGPPGGPRGPAVPDADDPARGGGGEVESAGSGEPPPGESDGAQPEEGEGGDGSTDDPPGS